MSELKSGDARFTFGGSTSYGPPVGDAMFAQEWMAATHSRSKKRVDRNDRILLNIISFE